MAATSVFARKPTCPLSTSEIADGVDFLTHRLVPEPMSEKSTNCTQYCESSCCSAHDTLRISHADPDIPMVGTTIRCRDALKQMMCSICSPAQATFYVSEDIHGFEVPVLRVCGSFCDRLFTECAAAYLEGREDRVDMEFEDSKSFCDAVGLNVAAPDAACFSSARPQRSAPAALAATGATLLASFASMRRR